MTITNFVPTTAGVRAVSSMLQGLQYLGAALAEELEVTAAQMDALEHYLHDAATSALCGCGANGWWFVGTGLQEGRAEGQIVFLILFVWP